MEPLAAGGLGEAREPQLPEQLAQLARGLDRMGPGHARIRIEVEGEQIGVEQVGGARPPGVDLERAQLHQRAEARGVDHRHVGAHAAALAHVDAVDRLGLAARLVLLEEAALARAFRTAQQRERPPREMRQHPVGDRGVVVGETALGDGGVFEEDPVGMGERNAHCVLLRLCGLFRGDLCAPLKRAAPRLVPRLLVAALDQEPGSTIRVAAARTRAHQVPAAAQLLAVEREVEPPARAPLLRVALGLPLSGIPDQHRSAAVLALRNRAFEAPVLERVVLDLYRQPLHPRVEARSLRDRPAPQHTPVLQAEVVVEAARGVLLHGEAQPAARAAPPLRAARLRRALEVPLASIVAERHAHGSICRRRAAGAAKASAGVLLQRRRWLERPAPRRGARSTRVKLYEAVEHLRANPPARCGRA